MATHLYEFLNKAPLYFDSKSNLTKEEYFQKLQSSTTVYVGNLSITTTENKV